MKKCITCEKEKELEEYYKKHNECKLCKKARAKKHFQENKGKYAERKRLYRKNNPEKQKEARERYYKKHADRLRFEAKEKTLENRKKREKEKESKFNFKELLSRVSYSEDGNGCWIPNGIQSKTYDGYYIISFLGKSYSLHRLSYLLRYGDFVKELCVLHSCDNPSCFNPSHLSLGTHKDNTQDMLKRGRVANLGAQRKLSKDDVKDIKRSSLSSYELSKIYPVTPTQIRRIKNGSRWKHV